ncbi:ArsR/SmtB family transcription factor [Lacticaseibacillus sp. GG6-2]
MEIELIRDTLPVIHALDSSTRIDIINLLAHNSMTVTELANELHYSKAIISKHIQLLKMAKLVFEDAEDTEDRRRKKFSVHSDNILINLPEKIYPNYHHTDYDIPLGNYFSYTGITPTCGLANEEKVIGDMDNPDVFLSAERSTADLMWFSRGEVEYIIPNPFKEGRRPELIEVSMEISSEFPASNNNWPSDIAFWMNDIKVGTWTVPGNYSDVRGRLTPTWWASNCSQYGLLKHLRILTSDTAMDGITISNHTVFDLALDQTDNLRFRIGVDPDSRVQGGLTIFGKTFGNYAQDIHITCYYSEKA